MGHGTTKMMLREFTMLFKYYEDATPYGSKQQRNYSQPIAMFPQQKQNIGHCN